MRKVRAGWYTETVVGFEERYETGAPEFHVDVSKEDGVWVVSYRRDITLMTPRNAGSNSHTIAYFDRASGAKSFALAVAYAYRNDGRLPNAETHEPYAITTWRFEKEDWWSKVILAEKRGE